jgi:hypothetical protein
MALLPFTIAVAAGGSVRALAYATFGATLPEAGSLEFYAAGAALLLVGVAPFAHPRLRARLLRLLGGSGTPRTSDAAASGGDRGREGDA